MMMPETNVLKDISKTPTKAYFNAHYFCDYIELLAVLNNTDIISISDVYDRFLEDDRIKGLGSTEGIESNDKWNSRITDWFILLENRQLEFDNFYPFEVSANTICLKEVINDENNCYLFLLLSSTRKYINDKNSLTTDFELVSFMSLKQYLPNFSKIYQFGKSNVSYDRYTGHITEKIDLFAKDLHYKTKYNPYFFAEANTGDGGLDLVSWVPFESDINQNNIQIYLSQCATGYDWLNKQDDTHKFPNNYIDFKGHINYLMFIPYDGRNIDSTFNEEAQMGTYLLFDRIRLLKTLNDYSFIRALPSFNSIVEKIIEFEEDIL